MIHIRHGDMGSRTRRGFGREEGRLYTVLYGEERHSAVGGRGITGWGLNGSEGSASTELAAEIAHPAQTMLCMSSSIFRHHIGAH
jgi:hypothetical protein